MRSAVHILPLKEIQESQKYWFGAKALNLGRMLRSNLDVPDGIGLSFGDRSELSPQDKDSILEHCKNLAAPEDHSASVHFAVRSSGADEDSEDFSFAGQFDSFLNVPAGDELISALSKCLDSMKSQRSHAYRHTMGIQDAQDRQGVRMGVIIQKMVPADFAGICMTKNPSRADQLVLEWVPGLGEGLVSGRITPRQVQIDRDTLRVISGADHPGAQVGPNPKVVTSLASQALKAEEIFGDSLDLEWACKDERVYLLQARPMSFNKARELQKNLIEKEKSKLRAASRKQTQLWTDFSIGDVLMKPSPLTAAGMEEMTAQGGSIDRAYKTLGFDYVVSPDTEVAVFESICGRSFINITEYLKRLFGGIPLKVVQEPGAKVGIRLDLEAGFSRLTLAPFALAARSWSVLKKFYSFRKEFHKTFKRDFSPALRQEATAERKRDLTSLSEKELYSLYRSYLTKNTSEPFYYHMLCDVISAFTQAFLKAGLALAFGKEASQYEGRLTTGLSGNFNTESNLALYDVARGDRTLSEFLDRYGHRGNPDWESAAPRWREDQTVLLQMIKKIQESGTNARQQFDQQVGVRLKAEEEFQSALERSFVTRRLKSFFLKELEFFQIYSPMREAAHDLCFLWIELNRRVILEMAERTQSEDLLFYFDWAQLESFFLSPEKRQDLLSLARIKKRNLSLLHTSYVPHILTTENIDLIGNPPPLRTGPAQGALKGDPIFNGIVTGPARVVKSLEDAGQLQKGEILVAQFTDPSWTPLFYVAAGLALEQGSTFSHGALVAREMGLPSIVNVPDVTRLIQTGDVITLDSYHGTIAFQ